MEKKAWEWYVEHSTFVVCVTNFSTRVTSKNVVLNAVHAVIEFSLCATTAILCTYVSANVVKLLLAVVVTVSVTEHGICRFLASC